MIQSAFDTVWSIKGMWWIFKLFCMTIYASVCVFTSLFFMSSLGIYAYILLAIVVLDYVVFWVRMLLACSGAISITNKKKLAVNISGALILTKMILRALGVVALLFSCIKLLEFAVEPFWLCIVLLVVASILSCFIFCRELIYTFYKFVKYRAKREMEEMIEEAKKIEAEQNQTYFQQ